MRTSVHAFRDHFPLSFWRSPFTYGFVGGSLLLNIGSWLLLLQSTDPNEPLVPLHYTISIGVDRIGQWTELFFMPGLAAAILVVNTIFAWMAWRQPLLAKTLHIGTFLVQVIVAMSTVFLVMQFY